MSAVRVSVVMPFLNAAAFLGEAVESVRSQSFPHWELFLCDDGSTDGSTALAQGFAAAEPARIHWLDHAGHETRGASAARNLGLAAARGDYLAFLDADDVWLPNKLHEQVALLDGTPQAHVLVGSTQFWYGWTRRPEDAQLDRVVRIGPASGSVIAPPEFLRRMLLGTIAVPCTCSLLVRRGAVDRIGGFEESFRKVFTDQSFYAKLFLGSSVLVVDDMWDRYRQQPDSACAVAEGSGELGTEKLRYLQWLEGYLAARRVDDAGLRAALRRATWRASHPRAAGLAARWRRAVRRLRASVRRVLTPSLPPA